ncbi:MAG: type IV pilus twitching motility protein PilT [Clostridia bacterium]|nr:MAG: type IV pilus twitching motility protein PilT [Clostridia bacterium]
MQVDEILQAAAQVQASDVHLTVGLPPVFRVRGELQRQQQWEMLKPPDTLALADQLMRPEQKQRFQEAGELDFAYAIPGAGRFRVNVFRQRGSVAVAMRLINATIPTIEELGLPEVLVEFTRKTKGLVLVTGPTGSGKSTTLAAMIALINQERSCHIITLEDPIEYLHRHNQSIVNQREIGTDSHSFAAALRASLREDPDVVLVGEMRDLETIGTAITAAETGHLVFATLHTASAAQTVDRVIDVFPPHQQQQVRVQLADTIQGIVAQQLLPRLDKPGRVAAIEVLVATPAIRNLIREGKTHQIFSAIQTGGRYGMQTMDMALKQLYQAGKISREEMMTRVTDTSVLMQMM